MMGGASILGRLIPLPHFNDGWEAVAVAVAL